MSLNTEIILALIASLTAISNPFFTEWAKNKFTTKVKKDPISQAIDVAAKVQEKLNKMREDIKSDKAVIIQFHNGGTFYPTGKSIAKFSVFYESLGIGIPSTQMMYQQVPVAAFYKLIEGVRKHRYVELYDLTNPLLEEDYDLSTPASLHKFVSYYGFGIFDIDDRMLGIMIFEYMEKPHQLSDLEINTILSETGVIGSVLTHHLNS